MSESSAVLEHTPAVVREGAARSAPVRVLAFVEARGVTGALRNLLDFATSSAHVRFELAMYWRSPRPGVAGPCTAGIQLAIDAAVTRGIPTHVLHERFAGDPRLLPQVRDLLRRTSADIIETHHVKSHALVAAAGVPIDERWIAFHHGYTATTVKTRVVNLLDWWSLTRPAAIVTPCRAFARELSRRGVDASRINVIHSSVALPPHANVGDVRAPLGLSADDGIVLTIGRLSKEKAHAVLVEAFARAPLAKLPNAALLIAGDGPERPRLAALARRRRLERVHFIGYQTNVWP
ncbi:MAG TPA: glycosyltransferase, partial [Vicinamibacterales bacterium]|nr:glycosyltransferase [Vicinamibacterales bacterium]